MSQQWRNTALMIVLTVMILMPQTGLAQNAKIAVVDIQALTLNSDAGQVVGDKLEKRYNEISEAMQKLQQGIDEKENRLRTQDRLMSATAKAQLSKEIDQDKINLNRKNEDYQKEYSNLRDDLLAPVANQAQQVLSDYVNEKGFTILFDVSAQDGNVVWANPANDITQEVMKRLNAVSKKAAADPAPSAPAGGQTPQSTVPPVPTPAK